MAKPKPKFPPSVHLPNKSVINAPANTPVIFMIPYAPLIGQGKIRKLIAKVKL